MLIRRAVASAFASTSHGVARHSRRPRTSWGDCTLAAPPVETRPHGSDIEHACSSKVGWPLPGGHDALAPARLWSGAGPHGHRRPPEPARPVHAGPLPG